VSDIPVAGDLAILLSATLDEEPVAVGTVEHLNVLNRACRLVVGHAVDANQGYTGADSEGRTCLVGGKIDFEGIGLTPNGRPYSPSVVD
jgi:hypothetical protein